MALIRPARPPFGLRVKRLGSERLMAIAGLGWAAFLTALVAGPWLAPGYLFGTDWTGPRRFDFPTEISSSSGLEVALALISRVAGSEATGKLFVIGILFGAGWFAYRAVPAGGFVSRAVAATIYLVNPFVYDRLHYGQFFLVAGYAVLPWVAVRVRMLLAEPTMPNAGIVAVALTLLGILSLHVAVISVVLIAALLCAAVVASAHRADYVNRLFRPLALAGLGTLLASSYWIIPLANGQGPEGVRLAGIGSGDIAVFAAVPDPRLGLLPNLLGLYGFWAEIAGRFTPMKAFVEGWPLILGALLLLVLAGVVYSQRRRDDGLAQWAAGLLCAALVALVLEMGVSNPWTAGLARWLDTAVPVYRGMRDAAKWGALLALAYSQLGGLGAAGVLQFVERRIHDSAKREWGFNLAAGLLLALPLYYGNGLLFGAHGEIKPSAYPAGWYSADRLIASDPHPGTTLFLPWHEYMGYGFIQNQNKVVAPLAPTFFSFPVLVSSDPEVAGLAAPADAQQSAINTLLSRGARGDWAGVLARMGIKYIVLARVVDWSSYGFLDTQAGLTHEGDFGSLVVYRVQSS